MNEERGYGMLELVIQLAVFGTVIISLIAFVLSPKR